MDAINIFALVSAVCFLIMGGILCKIMFADEEKKAKEDSLIHWDDLK